MNYIFVDQIRKLKHQKWYQRNTFKVYLKKYICNYFLGYFEVKSQFYEQKLQKFGKMSWMTYLLIDFDNSSIKSNIKETLSKSIDKKFICS